MSLTLNSGILAQSTPPAASLTSVYTVPANLLASTAINVCNRNTGAVKIRIAVTVGATTTYLTYDEPLPPVGQQGNNFCLRAFPVQAGAILQVYSDLTNVDFTISGFEQPQNFVALDS